MGESDTGKEKKKRDQHEKRSIQKQSLGGKTTESNEHPLELRLTKNRADFVLQQLTEGESYVADYTSTGKVGAALVLKHTWQIMMQGVKGDRTITWAVVRTETGPIGLTSIHGPRNIITG
ncbi:hypothetical protein R1sor_013705 [Riccia sorocarpa]|uniref:Uncharacterized protein n=1 Tax=Riccia sorocarpa TaxID=122646 RepID=A0ABD3H980_9MARC